MPVTGLRAPQEGGQGKPPGPLKSLPVPRRDQTMRRVERGKRLSPSGLGGHSISNILLWRPAGSQSFHRPHVNGLASRLPGFAKRQCFAARAVTGLLVKLALCRDEGRLSLGDQAFWNRPRCKVPRAQCHAARETPSPPTAQAENGEPCGLAGQ